MTNNSNITQEQLDAICSTIRDIYELVDNYQMMYLNQIVTRLEDLCETNNINNLLKEYTNYNITPAEFIAKLREFNKNYKEITEHISTFNGDIDGLCQTIVITP